MKRILTLTIMTALLPMAIAQSKISKKTIERNSIYESSESSQVNQSENLLGTETVIFAEDFANGLPSTWLSTSVDFLGYWEYRGIATSPSNTAGSRGAYNGNRLPILSPTDSNGFMIFDSDFLDNAGVPGNFGLGVSPSPHSASLVTPMIDLSNYSTVDLVFNQYYRRFKGPDGDQNVPATYIDISTDGGQTFPNTFTINTSVIGNASTSRNNVVTLPIGLYAGGQDSVKVRFRFDGEYYFWMIDDIAIVETPAITRVVFTPSDNAPEVDFVMDNSVKMGTTSLKQSRGITFDANVFSTGAVLPTNLVLKVQVIDPNNQSFEFFSSDTTSSLGYGDTLTWQSLNTYTSPFIPSVKGIHNVLYSVLFDQDTIVYIDTLTFNISDAESGRDFGIVDNYIGSENIGDNPSFAVAITTVDAERAFAIRVYVAPNTTPGTVLYGEIIDTSFNIDQNGGVVGQRVAELNYQLHELSSAEISQGFVDLLMVDPLGDVPTLNAGTYWMHFQFSNQPSENVGIANSGTYENGGGALFGADGDWYGGFAGSRVFENPMIRLLGCSDTNAASCMTKSYVTLDELSHNCSIAPNPATDYVNVSFGMLTGQYQIEVLDLTGKVVKSEFVRARANVPVFVGNLDRGMYVIRLAKGTDVKTFKVSLL